MAISVSMKNGQVVLDIEGMCGPACKTVMDAATKAAQLKVTQEDPKDEFHASVSEEASESEPQ